MKRASSRSTPFRRHRIVGALLIGAAVGLVAPACSDDDDDNGNKPPPTPTEFGGVVQGTSGVAVEGATVYLIPADSVPTTPITAAGILAGTAEEFDEPLEDVVRTSAASLASEVTDVDGNFEFDPVADGSYYVFVQPDAADVEHIPGGSACRVSYDADELRGTTMDISMSSSPSAAATFVGMSTCLACHPDDATEKEVAHRLGFKVPGEVGALQDLSAHPDFDKGLEYFLDAAVYTDGTPVYHYDYDDSRGFDKFKTSLTNPTGPGEVLFATLWLWKDSADGKYKITIENNGNALDPRSPDTHEVRLTYGGAVYKQRYMIEWEADGLNGLYPVLQFQHEGDDARYDRTRRQYRDYHLDFFWDDNDTPGNEADDLIAVPSVTRNISRNCMGCHAVDYQRYTDAVSGEVLCDTVEDPNGEYDIDGDGQINDLNLGCEGCHGPGSEHIAAAEARYIVTPRNLSPSREVQLCDRCHDRQLGQGVPATDTPLNAANQFPWPGISRDEFLTDYIDPSQKGPKASNHWDDFTHAKSHRQQGPDYYKSKHYRNPYHLVTCSDCHDVHGGTGYPRVLISDPREPDAALCMDCHGDFMPGTTQHTYDLLGVAHGAATSKCIDCHMAEIGKTGAGEYGYLLGQPQGTSGDDDLTYFINDNDSHIFDVPRKDNVGVSGKQPAKAMPIPYTNDCGTCHDPTNLAWQ